MGSVDKFPVDSSAPENLPFVAPCHVLDCHAPFRWLKLGWQDLKQAPRQSLAYGIFMVILSYLVSFMAYKLGSYVLLLSTLSGFVFIAPVLAIGLYSISCQIQRGEKPVLGRCLQDGIKHLSNEMIFAVIMLVIFLVWARAASMVHIFFPEKTNPEWSELITFFAVGSAVGSIFATVMFCSSAFSLPMIMERKVDVVTAVVTSINAVLRNKLVMLVWASLIVLLIALGFFTAMLGLVIILPLLGHATWHAYQETIDASAWPKG
ncbi:MAG: DUF2189 domain-containing protein [Gammaproteobacteria bacterium]